MMAVYAWGANSHGQLGLGHESEMYTTPQQLRKYTFTPSSVRCIKGGGGHVLILDACGHLHTCGWNNRGQLGLDITKECINEFKIIPGKFFKDSPIDLIACGWDTSGCITINRKLYVWGSNAFQQLGVCQRGCTTIRKPMPLCLPGDDIPVRLTFGMRHCAVLTNDWKLYIYGRLKIMDNPSEILNCIKITQNLLIVQIMPRWSNDYRMANISSGQNHVLIHLASSDRAMDMDDDEIIALAKRRVAVCGDNKYGQANAFQFHSEIIEIASGWTHNCVLLKDASLMSWGRNSYGQLGIGNFNENQPTPGIVKLSESVKPHHIHLGSEHGLLVTEDGDVWTWGWNEHGNCGNSSTDNVSKPQLIDLPSSCKLAGCGAGFCFAICESAT